MVSGAERLASAFATQAGNPKSQAPNPKQIRILESPITETVHDAFLVLWLRGCFGFEDSDFGFEILPVREIPMNSG
jgi:hypothetical protein